MLNYSLDVIPFSSPSSFLTITSRNDASPHRLLYRTASHRVAQTVHLPSPPTDFFEIVLHRNGVEVPYTYTAQPHRLDLLPQGEGAVTFVFLDGNTLLFEAHGVSLRLVPRHPFQLQINTPSNQFHLTDYNARGVHKLRAGAGTQLVWSHPTQPGGEPIVHDGHWVQIDWIGDRYVSGAIRFCPHEGLWEDPLPELADIESRQAMVYSSWCDGMPVVSPEYQEQAELAWFLLWNVQVPSGGALISPVMYMSKFWMNNIWAWDNCFNALAVARANPQLAWNQLLVFFAHQDENGMIPDMINDLEPIFGYNKPPIQGWTVRKLINRTGVEASLPFLKELYKPMMRLTEWWYQHRDFDADGMPQYHHGNDSGWDNATLFDQGYPTEGADLAAHLTLQWEALAEMADMMGKKKSADRCLARSQEQLNQLLKQGVKKRHFFSPLDGHHDAPPTQSLLNYIPLELGSRLPGKIRKALIEDISPGGPFLTQWGLATEAVTSPKYEADGYWRGPIWAPSTFLIFDGLVDAGENELAAMIARRFCDLCTHDPGFWENYDAVTGKGLRCPGYSWTASVFLLLAEWLANFDQE
ncbi:MAG: hypothetical protein HY835_06605 [Anaerolineae bacterium]|nr:hypothetical protein [Anaerolineae bacterium]